MSKFSSTTVEKNCFLGFYVILLLGDCKNMKKTQFLILIIIISMAFWGCVIELGGKEPSLEIVNQYYQPISEIQIFENTPEVLIIYNHFKKLKITQGKTKVLKLYYTNESFDAEIKVSFGDEYDITSVRFNPGKTTTVTLNENGILEYKGEKL